MQTHTPRKGRAQRGRGAAAASKTGAKPKPREAGRTTRNSSPHTAKQRGAPVTPAFRLRRAGGAIEAVFSLLPSARSSERGRRGIREPWMRACVIRDPVPRPSAPQLSRAWEMRRSRGLPGATQSRIRPPPRPATAPAGGGKRAAAVGRGGGVVSCLLRCTSPMVAASLVVWSS